MNIAKILITLGIILVIAGLLWPWIQKLGLFQLPGDIRVEGGNTRFYFPITTSIILSAILTLIFWLVRRF